MRKIPELIEKYIEARIALELFRTHHPVVPKGDQNEEWLNLLEANVLREWKALDDNNLVHFSPDNVVLSRKEYEALLLNCVDDNREIADFRKMVKTGECPYCHTVTAPKPVEPIEGSLQDLIEDYVNTRINRAVVHDRFGGSTDKTARKTVADARAYADKAWQALKNMIGKDEEIVRDANRWRKLIGLPRIRILGNTDSLWPSLRVEFWSNPTHHSTCADEFTEFVDRIPTMEEV